MGYKFIAALLFLFIIASGTSSGQFVEKWGHSYDTSGFDEGRSIVFANGSIFVAGISLGTSEEYRIVKYSESGRFLWEKKIDAGMWDRRWRNIAITALNDSVVIACTDRTFYIARYDLDGNLMWGEKWGKENSVTDISAYGGSIYVLGVSEEPGEENLRVLKYNLSGGMQWNITLDGTGTGIYACNNSVLVSGSVGGKSMLLDIDRNGNVLWNRSYGDGLVEDVAAGSSIYLLRSTSGNISVIKCDINGNEIWTRYYDDDIIGHSIAENKGNAFVAGSLYNESSRDYDFMVLEYNKDGQLIGEGGYNGGLEDEAWDMALDGDNTALTGYSVITKIVGQSSVKRDRDYFTVEYEMENFPPVANFSWSPDDAEVGEDVNFTDMSYDTDGSIVSYSWNFGDGATSTDQNPTHEYKKGGFYKVNLTVFDNDGKSSPVEKTIEIKEKERTPGFGFAVLAVAFCLIFAKRKIRLNF